MPARKRIDPPSKPTPLDGGDLTDDMTAGKDPDRHYVYVNPNEVGGYDAMALYEARGYVPEEYGPDSPRPLTARRNATGKITSLGQVLMSAPKSFYDERAARGEKHCKEMDRRILNGAEVNDSFRGGGLTIQAAGGKPRDVDNQFGSEVDLG